MKGVYCHRFSRIRCDKDSRIFGTGTVLCIGMIAFYTFSAKKYVIFGNMFFRRSILFLAFFAIASTGFSRENSFVMPLYAHAAKTGATPRSFTPNDKHKDRDSIVSPSSDKRKDKDINHSTLSDKDIHSDQDSTSASGESLLLLCDSLSSAHRTHSTPDGRILTDRMIRDSITATSQNNLRLYDSIRAKSSRRAVPRLLYNLLFIGSKSDTILNGQVLDESRLFEPYEGRTIGTISIGRDQVFDEDGNWFERTGNKTHVLTRERVIRRDLLFKAGDKLDAQLLVRNKQLLRSRPYISDAWVELVPDPQDSTRVDVVVRTRDSWTISADMRISGESRTMVGLYDANIFGTGNKLAIKSHFNRSTFKYEGNIVEYEIPNVLGTFYKAEFSAGRDFYNSELKLGLRKDFIRPTDYEVGVAYNDEKSKYYLVDRDTSELVKVRNFDIWGGRSRYIPSITSSIYFTGRYNYARYKLRPEVSSDHNPAFHNDDNLLFGLGLYREKFYSTNMVYGFGTREYLATGYKTELVGGYSWGEFSERMYLGTHFKMGDFTPVGYLMGGASIGSYINLSDGSWHRSAVDLDMRWISNLLNYQRIRIRQFLSLNYTQGWNRGTGSDEVLRFTSTNGLRTLKEDIMGINRMILNTETVFFTPFQPLGFRFAFFGFADIGLLGRNANPFNNEFCASFGVGLRIKNERLIFSTIQIQLGFSVGKQGWLDSRYFRISNETRLEQYRYIPSYPETVDFK